MRPVLDLRRHVHRNIDAAAHDLVQQTTRDTHHDTSMGVSGEPGYSCACKPVSTACLVPYLRVTDIPNGSQIRSSFFGDESLT